MLIFLVGFMGCGKSTIGRKIAKRLGYDFVDTDSVIEGREGCSVAEIFAAVGEDAFRRMERETIEAVRAEGNVIVATGGGVPCFGDNMELMKSRGEVVYFRMSPEMLFGRLHRGRARRPKLAGMDDDELRSYISATLAQREEHYAKASVIIDCDGVSDEYIANHITQYIQLMIGG